MWTAPRQITTATSSNEEFCSLTEFTPQVMSPSSLTTAEIIFKEQSSDKDAVPSYLCDAELEDETIGTALSSPLFLQERQAPADRRKVYHSYEESLSPAQSFSVCCSRTGRPGVHAAEKNQLAKWKTKQSGFFSKGEEQILARFRNTIFKHEFQADSERRSIQELSGIVESQRREIDHTLACDEQFRRDQLLLHEQLSKQNRDLCEADVKSFSEMEELKRFQGSTFDTIPRRKLVEDRDTMNDLTTRSQELQNEVNCLNDTRDF